MTPRRQNKPPAKEGLASVLAELLTARGWSVETAVRVGRSHADLIASDEVGRRAIFEIKQGPGRAHLGGLAQLDATRRALEEQDGLPAVGVLVVAGDKNADLESVSGTMDVFLLNIADADFASAQESGSLQAVIQGIEGSEDGWDLKQLLGELQSSLNQVAVAANVSATRWRVERLLGTVAAATFAVLVVTFPFHRRSDALSILGQISSVALTTMALLLAETTRPIARWLKRPSKSDPLEAKRFPDHRET